MRDATSMDWNTVLLNGRFPQVDVIDSVQFLSKSQQTFLKKLERCFSSLYTSSKDLE